MKIVRVLTLTAAMLTPGLGWAAIGCTLTNPSQDLKYLYPDMSSYKEELKEFTKADNGAQLFKDLRDRLGSDLDPLYETAETPYTLYRVFKGQTPIGVVHGVNVPGKGGVIQVFLSTDPETGEIRRFFFQRLESPAAKALRDKAFRQQFEGLTLADFYKHDYYAAADPQNAEDRVGRLRAPAITAGGKADYEASLRGIRKNLILLDFFVYGRRFEPFYERAKAARTKGGLQ